jgi:2-polyprenyl-3-methyl-5-hydroxy-6-metoxy-1,4-benzoquinol methylase
LSFLCSFTHREHSDGKDGAPDEHGVIVSMADNFHEANHRRWDAGSASWAHHADTRGIWKRCHLDPSLAVQPAELKWLNGVASKRVAVLGSGDNQVVFALAGMGAKVTSIDISERQLDVARSRAAALGLNVLGPRDIRSCLHGSPRSDMGF